MIRLFTEAYPGKNELYVRNLDLMFRPDTLKYIRKKAQAGSAPVYSYMFSTIFDYVGGKLAWHCSDIPFWFHNAGRIPVCQLDEGVTEKLENQMSMSIVNFARTGNPCVAGLPGWRCCTPEHTYTMVFDETCVVKEDYEDELLQFMEKVSPPFRFDPSMFADNDDEDEEEGRAWMY